jgi:uncharacterized DUF497 family protein
MQVGFDPAKSDRNERDRGFSFLFAARIFLGNTIERLDSRADYGEDRIVAIGQIEVDTLTVVYTWRTDDLGEPLRWIISARMASRAERRKYAAFFP